MCRLRNIALESVTEMCDRRTDRQTDKRTTDKVIPMCRYASQATTKNCEPVSENCLLSSLLYMLFLKFSLCGHVIEVSENISCL